MTVLFKNRRAASALLIATAMMYAPLAKADTRLISLSNCNGGMSLLVIPGDDSAPGKSGGNDCAKACHGLSERRDKGVTKRPNPAR